MKLSGTCQDRDFGNENDDRVKSVFKVKFAKTVIFGNHDNWNTHKFFAS